MKIKQYALATIARQKIGKYSIQDCIDFKEKNGVFPFYDEYNNEKWIYDFYVEYYKKFKNTPNNEFFTPLNYAENIRAIFNYYFGNSEEPVVLDAFCGIGNLTLGYYDRVDAFDINQDFLEICKYKNKENNKKIGKELEYNPNYFNAFDFDYDTRKFKVNELGKKYNCIISNPPFGKYKGSVIDKCVIEFFEKHLEKNGILIAILPNNFYDKYGKILDKKFQFIQKGEEVLFDYTKVRCNIFTFIKI